MRRIPTLIGTCACAAITALILTAPAAAREPDRDCPDFPNQAAAQAFFVEHGGSSANNFDDLDADHDGIACESLPCPCSSAHGGSGSGTPPPAPPPVATKPTVPRGDDLSVRIVRDVDGDTVYARYANGAEGYVRLIGIDTPEDVKPNYPVECGARAAARSMTAMAAGRRALLVTDPTQDRFDRYGRLLAYVFVDGQNVNRVQVRRGWADVYIYNGNPFEQVRIFRRAEASARSNGRGVWSRCGGDFHSASS